MSKIIIMVCDACKEVIPDNDYCAPHVTHALGIEHDTNTHYHTDCCPECRADSDVLDSELWEAFISNERLNEVAESMGL